MEIRCEMAKRRTKLDAQKQTEEIIIEFMKCKQSFYYFCSTYIKIELPGGDVPLVPYKPQAELIDTILEKKHVVVLKSRQIGISTITQAFSAWLVVFHENVVVGIISKDAKEATDFARNIRGMVEKLPRWMIPPGGASGPGFSKKTEQSFILTNGSKVYASPVNPNAPEKTLRGKAITFLIIDEAAFIKFMDDAWTSMVPALSTNQKQALAQNVPHGTIILSTPNKTVGPGKWFYEKYTRATKPGDIFTPFEIHWKDVPELANDPNWYDTQCQLFENDPKKIQQELELTFLPSSSSFFDASVAIVLQSIKTRPIKIQKLFNGEIYTFEEPVVGKNYLIGVDTASEHGSDFSAISVWDTENLNEVWEYQGKCAVTDFCKVVMFAASAYPGILVVENNSYGNQVTETLSRSDRNFNMYSETSDSGVVKYGVTTNIKSRPLMIEALYSYINQFPEIVKSKRLGLELIGLVEKKNGKVEGDGCNDDIVISASLAFYVHKYKRTSFAMMMQDNPESMNMLRNIMEMNDGVDESRFSNKRIMDKINENINSQNESKDKLIFWDTLSFMQD